MVGVELAHHHHALPLGNWHHKRTAAGLAKLAESLCRLVLAIGREVGGAQHEALLGAHVGQHAVELTLQATALGRLVAHEHAAVGGQAALVLQREVDGGEVFSKLDALDVEQDSAGPFLLGEREAAGEDVEQLALIGRDFRLGGVLEPLPGFAIIDRRFGR
jgi:hypothetical protein